MLSLLIFKVYYNNKTDIDAHSKKKMLVQRDSAHINLTNLRQQQQQ